MRQWDEDNRWAETLHVGDNPTLKAVLSQPRTWSPRDHRAIDQAYDVVIVDREPTCLLFSPKPKCPTVALVNQVQRTMSKDRLSIETIVIEEKGDDTSTIRFLHTRPQPTGPRGSQGDPPAWTLNAPRDCVAPDCAYGCSRRRPRPP